MQTTRFGRTGLTVSVAGLGCGGHSRLGQSYGKSFDESVAVVRAALDAGINFIDTAAAYGTEEHVGRAIAGCRDGVVVSTKTQVRARAEGGRGFRHLNGQEIGQRLDASLSRLGTDYIDVYNLHGVVADDLEHVEREILPALLKARDEGKIRWLGVTERFITDTSHEMLQRTLVADVWDAVMVGFNVLNPSARQAVLQQTRQRDVAVQNMFAVRRALSDPAALSEALAPAVEREQLDAAVDVATELEQLVTDAGAGSLVELAYRFCRHEPGIDVVLTGTGSIEHLQSNVAAINQPPLPADVLERLESLFGAIDSVSGN